MPVRSSHAVRGAMVTSHLWRIVFVPLLAVAAASACYGATTPATTPEKETFRKALEAHRAGHDQDAVALFERGLKDKPNDSHAWYYLGESKQGVGDNVGAVKSFLKSLELDPHGSVSGKASEHVANLVSAAPENTPRPSAPGPSAHLAAHPAPAPTPLVPIDEQYRIGAKDCHGGFLGKSCRHKIRVRLCEGLWSPNPSPDQSVCKR